MQSPNRHPYITHLNIVLYMVVSLYFGGKAMFQMGKMYFKEPCPMSFFSSTKESLSETMLLRSSQLRVRVALDVGLGQCSVHHLRVEPYVTTSSGYPSEWEQQ